LWFSDEVAVIEAVIRGARSAGWNVLVKPKPESRREELTFLKDTHPNVLLGTFHTSFGALNYHLSQEYNELRLAELSSGAALLNTVTTFGLDAACAGLPVLQVDLRACVALRTLAAVAHNHHLRSYLYPSDTLGLRPTSLCLRPTSLWDLEDDLAALLRRGVPQAAVRNSDRLRAWVLGKPAADLSAVSKIIVGGQE
jgi:hypothetical protein